MSLPATTHMGAVTLSVADLDRSIAYYENEVGLSVRERTSGGVELGTPERTLLVLEEEPGARPADGFCGLFHFALLVPERRDLGAWLAHASRDRVALTGASDHFVSEALYLRDPDHHGIEIYWDRPREVWEGQVGERMVSDPLDLQSLVDEAAFESEYTGLPDGTVMGHVHLRVADVTATIDFYRELGFDLMAQLGRQAGFLAAGGYHHHLGANTWESRGAPPAPEGTARLVHYTIVAPGEQEREAVDPSGNRFVIASAP